MMPAAMQVSAVKGAYPKREIAPHLANLTLDGAIIIDKPRTEHPNVTKIKRLFKNDFILFEDVDAICKNNGRRIARDIADKLGYVPWIRTSTKREIGYRDPEAKIKP